MPRYKERRGAYSKKWDDMEKNFGCDDLLPLWIADMDFTIADEVTKALQDYISHSIYGYFKVPESYWEAVINWEKNYGAYFKKKNLRFSPSVIASINWLIPILTNENESVIVFTPSYKQILSAIKNNERKVVQFPLSNDNGYYSIDYTKFESYIIENDVRLFIFCSPHNPTGRVWNYEEISNILSICQKHDVYVIADEIYQDIVFVEKFVPCASFEEYDDILITLISPGKSFNISGCRNSLVIIRNEDILNLFDEFRRKIKVKKGGAFGYILAEAAYKSGKGWLERVKQIIYDNYLYVKEKLECNTDLIISPMQGTFLCWISFEKYTEITDLKKFIINDCKIAVEFGENYGGSEYSKYIRVNIATNISHIEKFVELVINALKNITHDNYDDKNK